MCNGCSGCCARNNVFTWCFDAQTSNLNPLFSRGAKVVTKTYSPMVPMEVVHFTSYIKKKDKIIYTVEPENKNLYTLCCNPIRQSCNKPLWRDVLWWWELLFVVLLFWIGWNFEQFLIFLFLHMCKWDPQNIINTFDVRYNINYSFKRQN